MERRATTILYLVKRTPALVASVILFGACGPAGQVASHSPSPAVTSSPTPVATPMELANENPLIFFRDPADFDQIDAMTWDGVVGRAPADMPDYHTGNPQATLFGTTNEIRDRNNRSVVKGVFGLKSFAATWADDGVHYCLMQPFDVLGADGVPATLMVGSTEGGMQPVMSVGKVYEQTSIYVAGCAFQDDRALVVQSGGQGIGVAEYWVVQVSTHQVLWTRSFTSADAPLSVVSSHDVAFVAENYPAGSGVEESVVYDGSGKEVRRFDAAVAAFSWDKTMVVLTSRRGGAPPAVSTLDGRFVWTAPAKTGLYAWSAVAEPAGDRLAVAVGDPQASFASATWKGLPIVDLYVVDPDGRVVKALKGVYW